MCTTSGFSNICFPFCNFNHLKLIWSAFIFKYLHTFRVATIYLHSMTKKWQLIVKIINRIFAKKNSLRLPNICKMQSLLNKLLARYKYTNNWTEFRSRFWRLHRWFDPDELNSLNVFFSLLLQHTEPNNRCKPCLFLHFTFNTGFAHNGNKKKTKTTNMDDWFYFIERISEKPTKKHSQTFDGKKKIVHSNWEPLTKMPNLLILFMYE